MALGDCLYDDRDEALVLCFAGQILIWRGFVFCTCLQLLVLLGLHPHIGLEQRLRLLSWLRDILVK